MIRLSRKVRGVRCLGSVALELCEVAAGRADLFVTMRSSPWDHNAARVILEEAGGAIFTVDGGELPLDQKSTVLALNAMELRLHPLCMRTARRKRFEGHFWSIVIGKHSHCLQPRKS